MGQVSQLEDLEKRASEGLELPEFGAGNYTALTAAAKEQVATDREAMRQEKIAARRDRAAKASEELLTAVARLKAEVEREKRKFARLFYENKVLKAELARAKREVGFRLSWDATRIIGPTGQRVKKRR